MHENIINFKALPNFFPKWDSWGFWIRDSWYLAEQNDTKKALILIFSGFDQKSEFSYQPITFLAWWMSHLFQLGETYVSAGRDMCLTFFSLVRHVSQLCDTVSHLFQLGETCVSHFSIPGSNTDKPLIQIEAYKDDSNKCYQAIRIINSATNQRNPSLDMGKTWCMPGLKKNL